MVFVASAIFGEVGPLDHALKGSKISLPRLVKVYVMIICVAGARLQMPQAHFWWQVRYSRDP